MRRILVLAILASFLFSCSEDDVLMNNGGLTPLSISSVSLSVAANKSDPVIVPNCIGLFLLANPTNGYATLNDAEYDNLNNSGWNAKSTTIGLNNNQATVCAYSPFGASDINVCTNPKNVMLISKGYIAGEDLCYATSNVTPLNAKASSVGFTMSHAYSRITFILTRDAAYSGAGAVSQIQITNPGILSTSTLDITTGTYGAGVPGTVSYNPGISGIASGASMNTSVLMVPVTTAMNGNMNLACMVDGQTMKADLPVVANNLTTLDAGKNYQVAVSLRYSPESNCYMVRPNGTVYIPVSRANTGAIAAGLPAPISNATNWTAGLLWTDNVNVLNPNGVVASIVPDQGTPSGPSGHIKVSAGSATGNAVVYVKVDNDIVWSWHIWVTDYDPNTNNNGTTYTYNNGAGPFTFMDRNLGAISANPASLTMPGMYYQWGRKDPFPGPESIFAQTDLAIYNSSGPTMVDKKPVSVISNLSNAIKNPQTFYFSNNYLCDWYTNSFDSHNQNDALWGGANMVASSKTVFDPCPLGWRVPSWSNNISPWDNLTSLGINNDYVWTTVGYYLAIGFRNNTDGNIGGVGSSGGYWSASVKDVSAYNLFYTNGLLIPFTINYRAVGFGVRCVKN